jgi:hypothetical protein
VIRRAAVVLAGAALLAAQPKPGDDSPVLRAMRAELERSRALRVVGDVDAPYFIQYQISDARQFTVTATLGAVVSASLARARVPQVEVRVGSHDFDNTGHVSTGFTRAPKLDPDQWPLDNDEAYLRQCLWLATDRAFKAALESIGRKRASLQNVPADPNRQPDFYKAAPVVSVNKPERGGWDAAALQQRAVTVSAAFRAYPDVLASAVDLQVLEGETFLANSEGSVLRYPDTLGIARLRAEAIAADGMVVRDGYQTGVLDPRKLPDEATLLARARETAENLRALLAAPAGEAYAGPVLFEPLAAAQLLAQLLGDALRIPQKPVSDPNRPFPYVPSELEARLGARVLPDWMDVTDDPALETWEGRDLAGHYQFDLEGQRGVAVRVVEQGVLKNFLLTRRPVKGFAAGNGHARLAGPFGHYAAAISNFIVKAGESAPLADLKKKLIEQIQQRGKPYGVLIRKLDYPTGAGLGELRTLLATAGQGRLVSPPVLAYRVYPDGREELMRGLRFRGLSAKTLRDISAASRETAVFDFVNTAAPLASPAGGGFLAPASVIAPGLLIDDVELDRQQSDLFKPPLVPPPPTR